MLAEPIRDWTPKHERAEGLEMEWVPVQRAACRLRISPTTVRRWVASGKLNGQLTHDGQRPCYLVEVPVVLRHVSQGIRDQIDVLRTQLATRELQLTLLIQQNEKLEADLDAARRTVALQSRRRIVDAAVAASRSGGGRSRVPFLRLLKGRRDAG